MTALKVGLVVPHIFMQRNIIERVIFAPGALSLELVNGLQALGAEMTLFTPGPMSAAVSNETADLQNFEAELRTRGDDYLSLLKKHPLTFISLARQVQAELIAKAFAMANQGKLDIVHIYANEEDIALPFATLCQKPVVFTHHDPFSFLVKYRNVFPKYKHLNWISISLAQRSQMPKDTNWVGNIYHGLKSDTFEPNYNPRGGYVTYMGRIIESKGVHLAIQAVRRYNSTGPGPPYKLKLAGKHYAGHGKDKYWQERIAPHIDGREVEYVGFVEGNRAKQELLGNSAALLMPSTFEEPFGMVMIEALACGTPVIGLDSGAISEVVKGGQTGIVVAKEMDQQQAVAGLAQAIANIKTIDRQVCRADFEERFTLERMCREHLAVYQSLVK